MIDKIINVLPELYFWVEAQTHGNRPRPSLVVPRCNCTRYQWTCTSHLWLLQRNPTCRTPSKMTAVNVNCKNWGKLFYFKCGAGNVNLVVLGGPLDAVHHLVGQPGEPVLIRMFLHGVTPGKYENIAVGVDGYCRHNPVDIRVTDKSWQSEQSSLDILAL